MNIGSHIPSKNAVEEIKLRKGDTFQIFVSSPQMWKSPKPREDIDELQDFSGPHLRTRNKNLKCITFSKFYLFNSIF